jgi:hypothetical protein
LSSRSYLEVIYVRTGRRIATAAIAAKSATHAAAIVTRRRGIFPSASTVAKCGSTRPLYQDAPTLGNNDCYKSTVRFVVRKVDINEAMW